MSEKNKKLGNKTNDMCLYTVRRFKTSWVLRIRINFFQGLFRNNIAAGMITNVTLCWIPGHSGIDWKKCAQTCWITRRQQRKSFNKLSLQMISTWASEKDERTWRSILDLRINKISFRASFK